MINGTHNVVDGSGNLSAAFTATQGNEPTFAPPYFIETLISPFSTLVNQEAISVIMITPQRLIEHVLNSNSLIPLNTVESKKLNSDDSGAISDSDSSKNAQHPLVIDDPKIIFPTLEWNQEIAEQFLYYHEQMLISSIKSNDSHITHTLLKNFFENDEERLQQFAIRYYEFEKIALEFKNYLTNGLILNDDPEGFAKLTTAEMYYRLNQAKRDFLLTYAERADIIASPSQIPLSDSIYIQENNKQERLAEFASLPQSWGVRHRTKVLHDENGDRYELNNDARRHLFRIYCDYADYYATWIMEKIESARKHNCLTNLHKNFHEEIVYSNVLIAERAGAITTHKKQLDNFQKTRHKHYLNFFLHSFNEENNAQHTVSNEIKIPQQIPESPAYSGSEEEDKEIFEYFDQKKSGSVKLSPVLQKFVTDSELENEDIYSSLEIEELKLIKHSPNQKNFLDKNPLPEWSSQENLFPPIYQIITSATSFNNLIDKIEEISKLDTNFDMDFWVTLFLRLKNMKLGDLKKDCHKNLRFSLAHALPESCYRSLPATFNPCQENIAWFNGNNNGLVGGKLYLSINPNGLTYRILRHETTTNPIVVSIAEKNLVKQIGQPLYSRLKRAILTKNTERLTNEQWKVFFDYVLLNKKNLIIRNMNEVNTMLAGSADYPRVTTQSMYSLKKWFSSEESKLFLFEKWLLNSYADVYSLRFKINAQYDNKSLLTLLCENERLNYGTAIALLLLGIKPKISEGILKNSIPFSNFTQHLTAFYYKKIQFDHLHENRPDLKTILTNWHEISAIPMHVPALDDSKKRVPYFIDRAFPATCEELAKKLNQLLLTQKLKSPYQESMSKISTSLTQASRMARGVTANDEPLLELTALFDETFKKHENELPHAYKKWIKKIRKAFRKAAKVHEKRKVTPHLDGTVSCYSIRANHPDFITVVSEITQMISKTWTEIEAIRAKQDELMRFFCQAEAKHQFLLSKIDAQGNELSETKDKLKGAISTIGEQGNKINEQASELSETKSELKGAISTIGEQGNKINALEDKLNQLIKLLANQNNPTTNNAPPPNQEENQADKPSRNSSNFFN